MMISAEDAEKSAEQMTRLIASGYAGVLSDGKIVDRREHPSAVPIQKNTLLNVPEPIELVDSMFKAALKVSEAYRLVLMLEALGRPKDAARARERHRELARQFAGIIPRESGGNDGNNNQPEG